MEPKYHKIMIIDDSDVDTYITNVLIKINNLAKDIIEYGCGKKAIEYLESNKDVPDELPEIILLDLYMPIVDGFQFLELFDKINTQSLKKCKIYVVTSSIDDKDINRTKANNNVFGFISKPITAEFLNSI